MNSARNDTVLQDYSLYSRLKTLTESKLIRILKIYHENAKAILISGVLNIHLIDVNGLIFFLKRQIKDLATITLNLIDVAPDSFEKNKIA